MLGRLIDTALDRSVVGGYTRLGYLIRSRAWEPGQLPSMAGRTVLVTGASGGLGLAAAEGFAALGARLLLVVRDAQRGERSRELIEQRTGNPQLQVELCDLSSLQSVRALVARLQARDQQLDVLVNNAGVLPRARTLSADGFELAFATNVLGPFLLTNLLIPVLQRSPDPRIINVSSGGMYTQRLRVDDLESERGSFDGAAVYARTKRAQVVLTQLWAARLAGTGVVVHAMHPGWADTPGVRESLPRFHRLTAPLLRTPQQGADTIVWLGAAAPPRASSGGFWHDRRRRPTHLLPGTRESAAQRERLWEECCRRSGWHEQFQEQPGQER